MVFGKNTTKAVNNIVAVRELTFGPHIGEKVYGTDPGDAVFERFFRPALLIV